MYELINLTKRNLNLYFRDKLSVFFSLLSSIILIIIYVLFLGNTVGGNLKALLADNEISFLVYSSMLAGMLVLNTLTIPLGVLGTVVTDMQTSQLDAFLVSPVKRYKIILGYYIASYLITLMLSLFIWIVAVFAMFITTGIFYSFSSVLIVIALLPVFIFISTSFMILLTTFIPSINAFGAISGIFGSVIGFVSGIYIPLSSQMPDGLRYVSSLIPFTHMGTIFKNILLENSFQSILDKTNNDTETLNGIKDGFGALPVEVLGFDVPMPVIIIVSVLIAIALIVVSTHRLNKKMKK